MKKAGKIIIVILCTIGFIGLCFLCVGIYAKHELSKPVFEFPGIVEEKSASELPSDKYAAYDYVAGLYNAAISADNTEGSWHTDITAVGEAVLPFSDEDNTAFTRVWKSSAGVLSGLCPKEENIKLSEAKNIPQLNFEKADVLDFSAEQGRINDEGETEDDNFYFITLEIKPGSFDSDSVTKGEIFKTAAEELSSLFRIETADISADTITAEFKIDRFSDQLVSAKITKKLNANLGLLSSQTVHDMLFKAALPYECIQYIEFMHYGLHFTERQIVVQPKDMKSLPLEVWVNSETQKDEYSLVFDVSEDGVLDIDEDGVMTVSGESEEKVKLTATLNYCGKTYTDELTVYVTLKEVKTDEPS